MTPWTMQPSEVAVKLISDFLLVPHLTDSNLNLPILNNLAQHETSTLATEARTREYSQLVYVLTDLKWEKPFWAYLRSSFPECRQIAGFKQTLEEKLGIPVKPKKPLTPFFRFMVQIRPKVVQQHPDARVTVGSLSYNGLGSRDPLAHHYCKQTELRPKIVTKDFHCSCHAEILQKSKTSAERSERSSQRPKTSSTPFLLAEAVTTQDLHLQPRQPHSLSLHSMGNYELSNEFDTPVVRAVYRHSFKNRFQQEHTKIIAQQWQKLEPSAKQKFEEEFKKEMIHYLAVCVSYENSLTDQQKEDLQKAKEEIVESKQQKHLKMKKKELGKPKKPLSAFLIFFQEKIKLKGDTPFKSPINPLVLQRELVS
ncbi:unnamed protein product [Timema podura]|uniref:HMG box domain-containing protein n=1 Tax=Timema podura TaxID=61482 RepID=A0ABN7NQB9_TIMPD|nr:unnamed protein product [Timema podura]